MRSGRPLVALAVVVATLGPVAGARADGDPASDTLYSQRVYYPYAGGSKAAAADLDRALAAAARRGVDVRIALIAQDVDLGAVPQLFGQAQRYAQFLSSELPPTPRFHPQILVLMPQGYGFARGGKPLDASALKGLTTGTSPDELIRAGIEAVARLQSPGRRGGGGGSGSGSTVAIAVLAALALLGGGAAVLQRRRSSAGRSA